MKLGKGQTLFVSFMLFSLFFGAGNLIFPPFLGQNAGEMAPMAMLGFVCTAVVLPVLAVIVVEKFNGLNVLASKVNPKFAAVFTFLIYLSIGPALAIPRAASVPFEVSVAPYLPETASFTIWMVVYSLIFFLLNIWLTVTPTKMVDRLGKYLTPVLLILIVILFAGFALKGTMATAPAQPEYSAGPFAKGFVEGYLTMDAIAGLIFGLVITTTLSNLHITESRSMRKYTMICGILAGVVLAVVYIMIGYMGMQSSGVYPIQENGAWTLRCIVDEVFGLPGAVLLAAIFALACLSTCVGLTSSISQYFAEIFPVLDYKKWAVVTSVVSFIICNQGLSMILQFSVPVLNAIYPMAIVLTVLGLLNGLFKGRRPVYILAVCVTGIISIGSVLESFGLNLGPVSAAFAKLPLYSLGLGWVTAAIVAAVVGFIISMAMGSKKDA